MELLDERWTMLVIRELVLGSQHFNDLRRGLPRMSPTLLSKRLQQLERAGVIERHDTDREVRYVLTEAGHELRTVVEAVGMWGVRWIGELGDEDLDPKLLLWDMHRNVDSSALPSGRTVLEFVFADAPRNARRWWLVLEPDDVDVCDIDPGFGVDVSVHTSLRVMTRVWRGDIGWYDAIRSAALELHGPEQLRRSVPEWFAPSGFALVPRPLGR